MNKIRELRHGKGWTQDDLALRLNTKRQAVGHYETGVRDIDSATICKLCDVFGCTADYLLGRAALPSPDLTSEEEALLLAYRAADARDRAIVELTLAPYKKSAGSSETA